MYVDLANLLKRTLHVSKNRINTFHSAAPDIYVAVYPVVLDKGARPNRTARYKGARAAEHIKAISQTSRTYLNESAS
jgi:hypothetical protein